MNLAIPVIICSFVIIFSGVTVSYGEIEDSTKKESKNIVLVQNIQCKINRILIINEAGNAALCVKESSLQRFVDFGWSVVNAQNDTQTSARIINVFERHSSPGTYTVLFKICSGSDTIRTPQIMIISDSEMRTFNMIKNVEPFSCYNSATLIKSNNPNTVEIKFNAQNDQSLRILELEQKIVKLKNDLERQNLSLNKIINENNTEKDLAYIDKLTDEIQSLRFELAQTRSEYYNLLYSKYTK